jgi:phage gpG-like protein
VGTWANNIVTRAVKNWQLQKAKVPQEIANMGQNYFARSFSKGSFGPEKWKEVKRRTPGTYEYKYPLKKGLKRRNRAILVGETGQLRRASARSTRLSNMRLIKWANYLPYAAAQNYGTDTIPARRFMGINNELNKKINLRLFLRMKQTFK